MRTFNDHVFVTCYRSNSNGVDSSYEYTAPIRELIAIT